MPNKLNLSGILIKPVLIENNGGITFEFHIGKGSPANPLFFTNPALVKILQKKQGDYLSEGMVLGEWHYYKNNYIPSENPILEENIRTFHFVKESKELNGIGIARGLEEKVLSELKKRYGVFRVIPFGNANSRRASSLTRRGIAVRYIGALKGEALHTYDAGSSEMFQTLRMKKRARRRISQIIRKR